MQIRAVKLESKSEDNVTKKNFSAMNTVIRGNIN